MNCICTTTKERPALFALCEKWMARQTLKNFTWLVVQDGDPTDYKFTMGQEVIHRDSSKDSLHSLCQNWLTALDWLKKKKAKRVLVVEDDDYYSPDYLLHLHTLFDQADLAGFSGDAYFHVPARRFRLCHNHEHASLAATAFTNKVFPFVREVAMRGDVFIDMGLWRGWAGSKVLENNFKYGKAMHIGIKGLSGDGGASGHRVAGGHDPAMNRLEEWIGKDADVYRGWGVKA